MVFESKQDLDVSRGDEMNIRLFKKLHDILLGLPNNKFKEECKETIIAVEAELERLELAWSKAEKKYQDLKKEIENGKK